MAVQADEVSKALVIASEPVPVPLDMPRGLNQLRNTCYLNSLLQVCPYHRCLVLIR